MIFGYGLKVAFRLLITLKPCDFGGLIMVPSYLGFNMGVYRILINCSILG
jgi:hypothetical protein